MLADSKKVSGVLDRIFYAASGFCYRQSNDQKKSEICDKSFFGVGQSHSTLILKGTCENKTATKNA